MTKRAYTGRIWGLAVEHEWDETSSRLVSGGHHPLQVPSTKVMFHLYSLWQEKRDDYEDVSPRDFPDVTLGDLWELEEL